MRKMLLWSLALALCLSMAACAAPTTTSTSETPPTQTETSAQSEAQYHQLTAEEAKARMDSGDPIVIVDVRTQKEYDEKHIENAILIPNESIGTEQPEALPDLDAEILIYCRSGNRSRQAAEKLVKMGYTNVYDFGGINDWSYGTVSEKSA